MTDDGRETKNPTAGLDVVLTPGRRALIDVLRAADGPLDAESAWRATCKRGIRTCRSTTFRSLRLLADSGAIERVAMPGVRKFYRVRTARPQISLLCDGRNEVRRLPDEQLVQSIESALARIGYRLDGGINLRVTPIREVGFSD